LALAKQTMTDTGGDMRVLIIDDHKLFAEAIRSALGSDGLRMEMLPVATSAKQGLAAAKSGKPDLVLVDLGLPDESGIDLGRKILDECSGTTVLAVTALSDPQLLREAIKAGFHGFITKDTPMDRFVDAIRAAMSGQVVVPQRLAARAAGAQSVEERDASMLSAQLTPREHEVLAMLVEGARSEEIGSKLSISPNTVRTHIQNILMKLQVHSRLEAAAFAVRYGLVSSGRNRR
jgi:two-component system, NarL family, nitrate/nitrite response regulator NarL